MIEQDIVLIAQGCELCGVANVGHQRDHEWIAPTRDTVEKRLGDYSEKSYQPHVVCGVSDCWELFRTDQRDKTKTLMAINDHRLSCHPEMNALEYEKLLRFANEDFS